MTTAASTDNRIEIYLSRLSTALTGVFPEERDEIAREIRAHILDSITGVPDREAAMDRVFRLLGTPEELAAHYSTESLLTRAGHSFSPWLLLRTSWRWAKLGMKGTFAFFLALLGYGTTICLTVAVFLKPFMPSKIGMWLGPRAVGIGVQANPGEAHELLGRWFVPVIAVLAFAVGVGTTHALRWLFRRRSPSPAGQIRQTSG
jgi:hypothetical protein